MKTEQFTPKAGDEVFSLNGQRAEYACSIPGEGHIVRPIYEGMGDEDAPFVGEATTWSRIFSKPPTEVLHKEVQELTDETVRLNEELSKMREDRRSLDTDYKARMAKLQRHEKLKRLEDFLDGKLTHYAKFPEYGAPRVGLIADEKSGDERHTNDLKLLSLFGKSKGDIAWMLNRYYDGSGSNKIDVVPCCSEDEAVQAVRDRSKEVFAAWMRGERGYDQAGRGAGGFAEVAQKFGFSVPPEFTEWKRESEIKSAQEAAIKAEALAEAARLKLGAILQQVAITAPTP